VFDGVTHMADWFAQQWNTIVGEPGKGALELGGVRQVAERIVQQLEAERQLTHMERPEHISVGR
jgi:hypothetical protein